MSTTPPTGDHVPVTELWRRQARTSSMRVVLADGDDGRAAEAARRLDAAGLAAPVLVGDPAVLCSAAVQAAADASPFNEHIDLGDPLHVAALMVTAGEADACVGGATRPSADVVRAALHCIGLAPGVETISSCFVLVLPDGTPITFADCGVVPEPDAAQLASIAMASAATHESLLGTGARVAMLSYSTKGSAAGPRVERVRRATEIVRRRALSLAVDGELQFDAAWAPRWHGRRRRTRRSRAGPTYSSSPIRTRETSPTRSPNGWEVPGRTDRCCRAPQASCTTCPAAAVWTTSSPWPRSPPARPLAPQEPTLTKELELLASRPFAPRGRGRGERRRP